MGALNKDIILNKEQHKALFAPFTETILVKGVAGSGKTTIAAARAYQLVEGLKNLNPLFPNQNVKIGVFSFNRTLVSYLKGLFDVRSPNIEVTGIHSFIWNNYLKNLCFSIPNDKELAENVEQYLQEVELTPNLSKKNTDFFLNEFKWFKGMMLKSMDDYLKIKRKGREGRLSEKDKEIVWKTYEKLKIWQNEQKKFTYDDFPNIVMKNVKPVFDALIIDEAQDLSKACLTFLSKTVKPESKSIMILADAAQSIYTNGITWKGAGFTVHGSRSIELKQNFRNPLHVYKVAKCIIEKVEDKEDFILNEADCAQKNFHCTEKVAIIHCKDGNEQNKLLLSLLNYKRSKDSGSYVILTKGYRDSRDIQNYLTINNINCLLIEKNKEFSIKPNVYVTTAYSVKGLEFDYVFVLGVNENSYTSKGEDVEICDKNRKLLYTCLTRAKKNAYIFSSENQYSSMLDDIDKDLITVKDYREQSL